MRRVVLALVIAGGVLALAGGAYADCGGVHTTSTPDQIAQPAPPPPTQPHG